MRSGETIEVAGRKQKRNGDSTKNDHAPHGPTPGRSVGTCYNRPKKIYSV